MTELYVEPEAELELEDAADWYEQALPGLGLEFLKEMRERTEAVLAAPDRFPPFGDARTAQDSARS